MPDPVSILLVEDDPIVTTLLTHGLARADRIVTVATTWADAQATLETTRPALIVLDLMLPDADGRDVLVALRQHPHAATIPIFVLSSGIGSSTPDEEYRALGATRFLQKPFKPKEVMAVVDDALAAVVRR